MVEIIMDGFQKIATQLHGGADSVTNGLPNDSRAENVSSLKTWKRYQQ